MRGPIPLALIVVTAFLLLTGGHYRDARAEKLEPFTGSCEEADNFNWVRGDNHCFAIATVLPAKAVPKPVLRVYLHGDNSRARKRGFPSSYMYAYAARTPPDTVSVAMLRPEHFDHEGRQSSDKTYGRRNWETAEDIDEIAAAARRLRKHHNASRVVMIGHSGGANTSAVMLGRHPGTADAALLVGCACDKVAKAEYHGRRVRDQDLNPLDYVDDIPPKTRIIAVTGSRDDTNPASICRPYISRLKERGLSARLDIVQGAKHGYTAMAFSTAYKTALDELNKE